MTMAIIDKKVLKKLNSQLAASACKWLSPLLPKSLEQEVRDQALKELSRLLIKERQWVSDPDKDLKLLWEGLFYGKA